ncbi:hypothetical protein JW968_06330 [Candidatus Woesearchaeota archaeon]|nr:hypothetical protein [Candidatus Woesearchaeota archaeon]
MVRKKEENGKKGDKGEMPWFGTLGMVLVLLVIIGLIVYFGRSEPFVLPEQVTDPYVIVVKCEGCDTSTITKFAKELFPDVFVYELQHPSDDADQILDELGIDVLPAYVFSRSIADQEKFPSIQDSFAVRGGYYVLKPGSSGAVYSIG